MHSSSYRCRGLLGGLLFVLLAALLALAAKYDLAIDQAVYSPAAPAAVFMEAFGWWPLYLPSLFWGALALRGGETAGKRLLGLVLVLGGSAAVCMPGVSTLVKRGWLAAEQKWVGLAAAGVLALLAFVLAGLPARRTRLRLQLVCGAGFWLMAANNAVINLLKYIWARPRFDDMLAAGASFERFSAWFAPFGAGGSSFPSGHTAAAAGVLILWLAADVFPALRRHLPAVDLFCFAYIAFMAGCRVVIGRHFLSDTVAATLVIWALFWLVQHSPLWKNALRALRNRLSAI